MPAIHIPAAQQVQANKAGQTYAGQNTKTAAPVAPRESLTALIHQGSGDLHSMLAGGVHPENPIPIGITTELTKASDSVRGRLGGVKPAPGTVQQPGPAGRAAGAAGRARAAIERLI